MNESHKLFREALDEVSTMALADKTKFLEALLFYFTIAGRGIWSDDGPTDSDKLEAFKWLNELLHRIWNIKYELSQSEDNDSIGRLYGYMKFYSEQSSLLRQHLVPTVLGAFEIFKARQ